MIKMGQDLIWAMKILEKKREISIQKEREKSLEIIMKILEIKVQLTSKIIESLFLCLTNHLTSPNLLEIENLLLLKVLLKLLENWMDKLEFINDKEPCMTYLSLLINYLLVNFKVFIWYINNSNNFLGSLKIKNS